jgi:hypothetical protein
MILFTSSSTLLKADIKAEETADSVKLLMFGNAGKAA